MDPLDLYSLGKIGPIMRREQIERAAQARLAAQVRRPAPSPDPEGRGRLRAWSRRLHIA